MTLAPIALTCGEPAGVGPELALAAWREIGCDIPFFLIADRTHMAALSRFGPIAEIAKPSESHDAAISGLPMLHHPFPAENIPGTPNPKNAAAVIDVIQRAVNLVGTGLASAVCTGPINKKALKDGAGFAFPGHTEFLAHLGEVEQSVMMLASPGLRVVPATIHIPLSKVPNALTSELLENTIRVTHRALIADFGFSDPRIAIAGLNPHAGEGGAMGHEEMTVIEPVLKKLRGKGFDLIGPMSADTMFHAEARQGYDLAICMYHDQALIPIKTLDFHGGTNVTLGLPFIRTSPDHGTALDIAGQGTANPSSLIAALRQADSMAHAKAQK